MQRSMVEAIRSFLLFLTLFWLALSQVQAQDNACDDKMLLSAVDLRLAGATAEESGKILKIVKLWNSDDYQVREQASRDLLEMGMVAVSLLDRIKQLKELRAVQCVSFSPDNTKLAISKANSAILLLDLKHFRVVRD